MPRDKNIFTLNPTSLDMKRSVFNRPSQLKTSFNMGQIIPIYMDEILPGDTVSMDMAHVIRMGTPIAPIMDNIYADVYFFFVPNRLVWSHWEQFCGANDTGAWTQTNNYTIPQATINPSTVAIGSLADYFGIPAAFSSSGSPNISVGISELPLRAYYKCVNDWFIDENSIGPTVYTIGDTANTAILYSDNPVRASRFHDLFSSCLPAPQKGGSVELPLGSIAPVFAGNIHNFGDSTSLQWRSTVGSRVVGGDLAIDNYSTKYYPDDQPTGDSYVAVPSNLWTDLSHATAATVNEVRMAFQLQRLLEKDARGGTRYQELLLSHFGVRGADARLQRAEYLAGKRFRINVDQVVSTADTGSTQSETLGNTGAVSKTAGAASLFTKSFTEHGILLGLVVIRQDHTYSEGIDKYWTKSDRFDFYYPVLANIGEVPVYKSELSLRGATGLGAASGVFGYQEAWYEYRYKPSRATGFMNPSVSNSLNYWTLGDVYSSAPSLGKTFLEETGNFLDRALAVSSQLTHQFIADFYFKPRFSRVMPLYSIPGLIDHH